MSQSFLSFGNSVLSFGNYIVGGERTGPTLPQYTVRFKFDDTSYDPTASGETWKSGSSWSRVSSEPNVWDYYHASDNWIGEFESKFTQSQNYVHVLDSNFTGVVYTDYPYLFQDCIKLRTAVIRGAQDASKFSFTGCTNLTSCSVYNFRGSAISMFSGCTSLTDCVLGDFAPTSTSQMFNNATSLVTAPDFDCASSSDATHMFYQGSALTSVPDYNFGLTLTNMVGMFSRCTSLANVPSTMITSNVTNMDEVCRGTLITAIPSWDTGKVARFDNAFCNCSALATIGTLDVSSADDVDSMFEGCRNVTGGALAMYTQLSSKTIPPTSHTGTFKYCGSLAAQDAPIHAEMAQIPTTWGGTMAV